MRLLGVLDFLDVTAAAAFDVPPAQAIAYFEGKGLRATFSYADMLRDEHRTAFTIAKMMDLDLLKDVQDSLDMALADGVPFSEWRKQIMPVLQAKGWWGKANMVDPLTGELKRVTLGTPHRLATIFRTNMQASYAVGAWEQIEAQAADAPYLMYDAVDDFRTRPAHRAWDDKVLRWDDKWWRTHYPPNGFNSVVPNQRVSGFAYLGLKAWYSGPVVEVVGRSGGRFTVTAQHPVLTTRGWVDAKDLRKGDKLIAYRSDVCLSAPSADLHEDDLPPTIEQAFEALGTGARASLQRAALYLNGDVEFFDGDVDVVGLDRKLVEHVQASANEFVAKLLLLKADHAVLPAEPGHCALAPIKGGGSGDGAGLEGDFAQMAGSVLPFNAGLSVRFDPISAKVTCNILPAFPESLGKLPQSHAGLVQLNDSIRHGFSDFRPSPPAKFFANNPRGLGFGSLGNSSIAKRFIGGFEVNANAHGDIIDAHAGLVELDDVADLIFRDYNGHVYDLQTATGNIAAFGGVGKPHYVISNCRCSVIQLDDNDLESMGLTVDKAPRTRFEDWRNPRTGQVERIPEGIDPGFDHNPGKRRMEELGKLQDEKIKALPKNMRKNAQDGAKKAEEAAKATEVFDTSTDAGKWHAKSWDGAPDWVRASIIREQAVEVSTGSGGAWARGGHLIHMAKYTPDNAQQRGVWRHEFGHVLDYRLQPGFDYYSAGQEFTKAMQADSRDLLKRTSIGMTVTSRQQRVHFLRQYDEIRDAVVDIEGRELRQAFLRQEAKRIGIDFDDLVTMLTENSAATFDGISGEVKLARILRAIEIGDAERFVYEAVGMDSSDWHVRRESLKKGNLGSFSDLIGAATGNKAANHHDGFAGHSNSYYRRPGARQTEVFANLTSLAGGPHPILWELAQRFFPKVTKAYQEALIRGNRL